MEARKKERQAVRRAKMAEARAKKAEAQIARIKKRRGRVALATLRLGREAPEGPDEESESVPPTRSSSTL